MNDSLLKLLEDMRRAQRLLVAATGNKFENELDAKVIGEFADRLQGIIGSADGCADGCAQENTDENLFSPLPWRMEPPEGRAPWGILDRDRKMIAEVFNAYDAMKIVTMANSGK